MINWFYKDQFIFVMGRDPVELAKRAKYQPPAMRVRVDCYTKEITFPCTIKCSGYIVERKGNLWRRKNIHSHIQNGCANIISSSHLSIDEK